MAPKDSIESGSHFDKMTDAGASDSYLILPNRVSTSFVGRHQNI